MLPNRSLSLHRFLKKRKRYFLYRTHATAADASTTPPSVHRWPSLTWRPSPPRPSHSDAACSLSSSQLPRAHPALLAPTRRVRRPPSRSKPGAASDGCGGGARAVPALTPGSPCCKHIFQVFQMFRTYVSSVSCGCCKSRSGCCICCNDCKRMLQLSVPNVSSVFSDVCAIVFIWMLHMFHTYVASVLSGCCVYLQ